MMIKIITKQSKVIPGIQAFLANYPRFKGNKTKFNGAGPFYSEERLKRVSALIPETCSVAEFEEALDGKHWTYNMCDECGEDFDMLVQIGQEPDYDARWLCLCTGCLESAVGMLSEYKEKNDEQE